MQDRYFVYLLSAGDGKWGYIGQTKNMKQRFRNHRSQIKAGQKPDLWNEAINEFPNPDDWEMTEIAGPFSSAEEALVEEARLQIWAQDEPGRLWEKCGNNHSDERKETIRQASIGENNPYYGKTHSDEAKAKIAASVTGLKHSEETKEKLREAAKGENNPMYGKPAWNTGKTLSPKTIAKIKVTKAAKRYTKAFFEWLSEPIT